MSEVDLWKEYARTRDRAIREEIVRRYLPLVKYIAGRIAVKLPVFLSQEDLESCGVIGLLEAVDRYDPELGVDFEQFAHRRIRGAMLDELRRSTWLPRTTWQKVNKLHRARRELEAKTGGRADLKEVAQRAGIRPAEVDELAAHYHRSFLVSLDEVLGDTTSRITDLIDDPSSPDPLEKVLNGEETSLLSQAISQLNERDRIVLALYYREKLTLKEIGKVLEVSESRVWQLHARALANLRKILEKMME